MEEAAVDDKSVDKDKLVLGSTVEVDVDVAASLSFQKASSGSLSSSSTGKLAGAGV